MTRFCTTCRKVVPAGHGNMTEIDGKKVRTCKAAESKTEMKSLGRVHRRLRKKLKANQNDEPDEPYDEMSMMMTIEQAKIVNAGLPEGYKYVLAEELQQADKLVET